MVLWCGTHGHAFTLFPPGFAPYLRSPVLRLSPDGGEVLAEGSGGAKALLEQDFCATIFDAALDAAEGRAWPRGSLGGASDHYWGNQCRRLEDAAQILGLAADLTGGRREEVAQVLSVEALALHEEAQALKAVPGYRRMGLAIVAVLSKLRRWTFRALRLLVAGHLCGRWGRPLEWDPDRRCFSSLPFPVLGTGPPS